MSEITSRQIPNIDNHHFYVDKTRNQFSPCWFVTCDRERAERILRESCKRKNGNVLMRAKRSEDGRRKWKYVISTYREKRDDFLHYRILDKRDGSLRIDIDQQHQPLASLTQALDCFLEMASNKNFQLRPINLSQNSSTKSSAPTDVCAFIGSTSTVKKQSSVQQNVPAAAAQSSAFNPADYLDMSEVVDSEQLTPPPCTDAVMQSLFNTEYLTIQDNNYSVIEERERSNSEFYQNQAQPLNSYRNIQPNGIPSIRPRDLPYQPDSNYLQPNKDTKGASKRESDIYRHLLNTPTSPQSPSVGDNYLSPQSPNMGDYLTIDSTDTKTTPAKQPITSPTRQASKDQPKNSESVRPSSGASGGPSQENLPAHYEVPGNCRSVVKDEGGYASPHSYKNIAQELEKSSL